MDIDRMRSFRVIEPIRERTSRYDLTPAEREAVMRENERRGVLHLIAERDALYAARPGSSKTW